MVHLGIRTSGRRATTLVEILVGTCVGLVVLAGIHAAMTLGERGTVRTSMTTEFHSMVDILSHRLRAEVESADAVFMPGFGSTEASLLVRGQDDRRRLIFRAPSGRQVLVKDIGSPGARILVDLAGTDLVVANLAFSRDDRGALAAAVRFVGVGPRGENMDERLTIPFVVRGEQ